MGLVPVDVVQQSVAVRTGPSANSVAPPVKDGDDKTQRRLGSRLEPST